MRDFAEFPRRKGRFATDPETITGISCFEDPTEDGIRDIHRATGTCKYERFRSQESRQNLMTPTQWEKTRRQLHRRTPRIFSCVP